MTVKIYPDIKGDKSDAIIRFFQQNQINCELISPADMKAARSLYRVGEVVAVEVNGRLFVDPNDDALRKILEMN